jgi:hypothetical protein
VAPTKSNSMRVWSHEPSCGRNLPRETIDQRPWMQSFCSSERGAAGARGMRHIVTAVAMAPMGRLTASSVGPCARHAKGAYCKSTCV